jgi:hypothetical protein
LQTCTSLIRLLCNNCIIDITSADAIAQGLVNAGKINGLLEISNQTPPITINTSVAPWSTLTSRGWNIIV